MYSKNPNTCILKLILTHIMDFSIPINWMSPFPNLGMSGAFFYFDFIFNRISCKQTVKTLIRRLVLRRLIWICTVFLCPKNGTLGLYELIKKKCLFFIEVWSKSSSETWFEVYVSLVTRKPVFGVFEHVRLKPVCSVKEASYNHEITNIETRGIKLSRQRTTKALTSLRRLICIFVVRIWHKHVFSWHGSRESDWDTANSMADSSHLGFWNFILVFTTLLILLAINFFLEVWMRWFYACKRMKVYLIKFYHHT